MSRSFRATLILLLVGLGTGLAAVAGWRYARISSPVSGPIVLVSVDALRADRVVTPVEHRAPTPAIDALAADGVLFERAFAHSPQTLPGHVSLLSGRLPFDAGVRDNVSAAVPESTLLLAQLLAERGYATGGVVSSFALRRGTGLSRGFAFFDDEMPGAVSRDGTESETRAERWLSAAATSRAFLFLHLAEPSAPHVPPARFAQLPPYDGEVAYADEIVGRLTAYLKKQQLYEQATIIVVGAQGESLGAHGEREHGLLVFDETIRVPLIIKPGAGGGGRRVAALVQHVDIVPTILDLAKAPIPSGLAGRSLKPLLEGGELPGRVAYAESLFGHAQYGWSPLRTVSDGRFRYIDGPRPALYDTESDPHSGTDVTNERPDDVARLAEALRAFEPDSTATLPAVEVPARDRDRLFALGFIGPRALADDVTVDATVDPQAQVTMVTAYQSAIAHVGARRWNIGLDELRSLAERTPAYPTLWASVAAIAERADRYDVAADAYRRLIASSPPPPNGVRLRLSQALFRARRLDDARRHAELVAESTDPALRTKAHALLARIAVAKREPVNARAQAQHVAEDDTASAFPAYIEGRLLMDRGEYEEAAGRLDEAVAIVTRTGAGPIEDLFLLRGDVLARLERTGEAENAYLEELEYFPENIRAMSALATLYHDQQRKDEAVALLTQLVDTVGTAEAYQVAAQLWTTFGEPERAAEVRSEAQRSQALAPRPQATHH